MNRDSMQEASTETLASRMRCVAQQHLERPAIIEEGRETVRYGELLAVTDCLGVQLFDSGMRPGNRVALVIPNGTWFVSAFFAVAHLGGVVVPLNPSLREREIAAILEDAEVSVVVAVRQLYDTCVKAVESAHGLGACCLIVLDATESTSYALNRRVTEAVSEAKPDAPALYLYSSGSTGRPKRIERTHTNLLWEIGRLGDALRLSSSDRILGVAPFSHTNGLIRSMIASVLSGATLITAAQFDRRAVARLIEETRATVFIGVPFMFAMLGETRWPRPLDFSSLRLCISSSAPLRPETWTQFYERYKVQLRQLYGTTETGSISVNVSDSPDESIESVGTPLPGIAVEIFSEEGHPLGPGESGEIAIESPAAASGYANSPDQSAVSFKDGYFFSGDIGYKDGEERIYLVGRKTLFINRGGYKVNPYEVEDLIHRHPKVQEAVVMGVATTYGDQRIKAIIVSREPAEEREIIEFCRNKVADFKVPSIVEFRTDLPKSSTGKILRSAL